MKLIIDISDHLYNVIKNKECTNKNVLTKAVENSTPFDFVIEGIKKERYNQGFVDGYKKATKQANAVIEDIKAEIRKQYDVHYLNEAQLMTLIDMVVDKHIGKEKK